MHKSRGAKGKKDSEHTHEFLKKMEEDIKVAERKLEGEK
ncbi:hypothetical protein BJV85_000110 [Clostridium acetobutylicum]|nr:hypothetical protein [Clostridium acetobutylicum]NOW14515.1 hypothetical protein [Clostridium acetobutylicum]NRY58530.1 hypothetical protein [Clostridium acetobutylicum]NSA91264.1 hypothetical protein [Clostridium acetobutylicum]NYC92198.1 hypothetical protein [Clostridium acetobutylicum]